MSDLQGKCIPKLLAHVRLCVHPDSDLEHEGSETAKFLQVNGIIMEEIDGFSLDGLASSPLPPSTWKDLLQRTLNSAKEINMRGVVWFDGRAGNVIVNTSNKAPFIHDFAQFCVLRGEDPKNDRDYGELASSFNNATGIVIPLANRLQRETGILLDLEYPDMWLVLGLPLDSDGNRLSYGVGGRRM